jgi:hypothetical protein
MGEVTLDVKDSYFYFPKLEPEYDSVPAEPEVEPETEIEKEGEK